ncbi:MAG: GH32 C-terminal domain-containing protein, partial [Carnobacterium inhibens]
GKLIQYPIAELANLRKENSTVIKSVGNEAVKMTSLQQDILIEWSKAATDFVLTVRNEVEINYQANSKKLTVIRTNWKTRGKEERSVFLKRDLMELRIMVESSLIELFLNRGEEVFTLRYFVDEDDFLLRFNDLNETAEKKLTLYSLDSFVLEK